MSILWCHCDVCLQANMPFVTVNEPDMEATNLPLHWDLIERKSYLRSRPNEVNSFPQSTREVYDYFLWIFNELPDNTVYTS